MLLQACSANKCRTLIPCLTCKVGGQCGLVQTGGRPRRSPQVLHAHHAAQLPLPGAAGALGW